MTGIEFETKGRFSRAKKLPDRANGRFFRAEKCPDRPKGRDCIKNFYNAVL